MVRRGGGALDRGLIGTFFVIKAPLIFFGGEGMAHMQKICGRQNNMNQGGNVTSKKNIMIHQNYAK